ncbi:MAG: hypothetical protein BGO31_06375 [Bacteroidetes bacterium 43-16]|nr:MAG: hypothetical protein BGO31_06375 [Bacteroidetes bacterium 43-16]
MKQYLICMTMAGLLLGSCSGDKVSQETKATGSKQAEAEAFKVLYSAFDPESKNYKVIFSDAKDSVYLNSYYEGEEKLNKNAKLVLDEVTEYDVRKYTIISGTDSGKFIYINELSLKFECIDAEGKRLYSLKLQENQ